MADAASSIIGEARGFLSGFETEEVLGSYTRARVERIVRVVVGLGCLVFGGQAIAAAAGAGDLRSMPQVVLMIVAFTTLGGVVVGCLVNRSAAAFATVFAVGYVIVLIAWPFVVAGTDSPTGQPWIYFLMNVATAAAVLAFPLPLQLVWTIGVPLLYGLVRVIEQGFSREAWIQIGLDTAYGLVLGGAIFALVFLFRRVAVRVDDARSLAVRSFASAAAADAAERERVAVSALMHDSVLAALIAAERARSPRESHLAVSMAREALTRLANAERDSGEGSDSPVTLHEMSADLGGLARKTGTGAAVVHDGGSDGRLIPGRVARAVTLAAAQAVSNAVTHARGAGLAVHLEPRGELGVAVEVSDRGAGFDVDAVPEDRLGIRGSIIARLSAVGGTADVQSGPGGTRVVLAWEPSS